MYGLNIALERSKRTIEGEGTIKFEFMMEGEEALKISITDDGIGR